jgi:transcriptional antiterminator NusG
MNDSATTPEALTAMDAKWYVINTYSGHENKARTNLEHRIQSMNQAQYFEEIVVPTEQVVETKGGEKVQV